MQLAAMMGTFLVGTAGTLLLGLFSKWMDRKVTARIQYRVGPPLLQPVYDVLKLLGKETLVPESARKTGFLLAPLVGFAAAAISGVLLLSTAWGAQRAFIGDLIVVWYFLMIPSLSVIVGGAASGSPYGAMGASREMKLVIAYELPLILAVIAVLARAQLWSFRLEEIVAYQQTHQALALSVSGALALLVAILCMQAKLGLVPFDMPEAETELMGGPFVEYSGAPLAVFYLMRAMLLAVLPLFIITVFLGGVDLSIPGILWTILKFGALVVVTTLIRNTNPRLRIDHALKFFWYILTPVSLLSLILALAGW